MTRPVWVYNDGGRASAGFRGKTGDCVTRAIAIASGHNYRDIYDLINDVAADRQRTAKGKKSSARTGVHKVVYAPILAELGFIWTPTMSIGSGTTVHLRADELPDGRIIARCTRHLCAMIDGVIHDTNNPSRDGTRCVYGYWTATRWVA